MHTSQKALETERERERERESEREKQFAMLLSLQKSSVELKTVSSVQRPAAVYVKSVRTAMSSVERVDCATQRLIPRFPPVPPREGTELMRVGTNPDYQTL